MSRTKEKKDKAKGKRTFPREAKDLLCKPELSDELAEAVAGKDGELGFLLKVLKERTRTFNPYLLKGMTVYKEPKALDRKTAELVAVSAAAALHCEHCLEAHMARAVTEGATLDEIMDTILVAKGISQATAARIKAALNLGLRLNIPGEERPMINSPADAAALIQYEMSLLEKEHLKVILLDRRNRVLDIVQIYEGSVNSSQVRIGEVFRPAIQRMASAIIAAHNHPSTDNTPSPDDVAVTRAMVQAGKLLDISVLDHLIVSSRGFVSLKERGLGFS